MLELRQYVDQIIDTPPAQPTPVDDLRRRGRRRIRRQRRTVAAVAAIAICVGLSAFAALSPGRTTTSRVITLPQHQSVPPLVDSSLHCDPQTCAPGPDGYSDVELQMAGITRTYSGGNTTYTEMESNLVPRTEHAGCPPDCMEEYRGTTQNIEPTDIARRVDAIRTGAGALARPDLQMKGPCLSAPTEPTLRQFLGLAPGFAGRLASENGLTLRTRGTNGQCHPAPVARSTNLVEIDVVDGIVVGASWGS
jgi:hypothetical protein